MQDSTIYFPTFLDFRGRVYPITNYLNYQGNDIARSLLLFKNVENKFSLKDDKLLIVLDKILGEELTEKLDSLKLKETEYLKLYLANVYGLNKESRKKRIDWFNTNISTRLNLLNNNINFLNEN